ncbi:MAG: transglycosylase domain-containing protein, partial [Acidimicrobiia bacterium]|nr:transglycosylase domain-containing protein [Acidimicrobiia bacterium]
VYSQDGVELGELTERNSQPVSLDEMPDLVVAAMLSAEDKSFYEHEGIDFSAIGRAVVGRAFGAPAGGGSTITQQVVKQNFLSNEVTIERKLCEAVLAAEIERTYTKDQILEFWANSVFFGSNAYGIRAASEEYFGKDLEGLTIAEAALLPVPIRNPTFYHPRFQPANALAARNRTIDRMVANGYILPADGAAAKGEPLGVIPNQTVESVSPQVMLRVKQQLLDTNKFGLGATYDERKRAVFGCPASVTDCDGGGGLKIDITVNDRLQTEANRLLRAWFRPGLGGPTGAISTIDNATGAIRVMASGLDFGDDIEAGQRPYDLASAGRRQPGSAFKPIALAAALESGARDGQPITLGTYWDDSSPAVIPCDSPCPPDNDVWTVHNAGGDSGHDLRTLDSATYNSTNTVYARLVAEVGPDRVVEMAHRLGIRTAIDAHLSITLGAEEVTPEDMAVAYSTLASYGSAHEPYLIERITDSDGTVVYEHQPEPREVLSADIAAAVVGSLKKVVTSGTGRRADLGRPAAGKTGTATRSTDVWFVGFIPQLSTAVWVGDPDGTIPLEDFTVYNDLEGSEQFYRTAFGGTLAAPIWRQFMEYATIGIPVVDFPTEPPGADLYRQTPFTRVPVEALTTEEMIDAIYAAGLAAVIEEVPSALPQGSLVTTVPASGATLRQGSEVVVQVSSGDAPSVGLLDLRGTEPGDIADRLADFADETGVALSWTLVEVETT